MCGEHLECLRCKVGKPGSPPHVRGTLHLEYLEKAEDRITPACAGNTKHQG